MARKRALPGRLARHGAPGFRCLVDDAAFRPLEIWDLERGAAGGGKVLAPRA